jgi:hypothetical protein
MSKSRAGLGATFLACGSWLYFAHRRALGLFLGGTILDALIIGLYFPEYVQNLNQIYILKGSSYVLKSRADLLSASWEARPRKALAFCSSRWRGRLSPRLVD